MTPEHILTPMLPEPEPDALTLAAVSALIPPSSWPAGLVYLHPVNLAYTSSIQCDADGRGNVYFALVLNPPGQEATQYAQIVKFTAQNQVIQSARFYARDSRAYLLANGCDPEQINGKYGNVTVCVSGGDLVLGFEIRINGVNTSIPIRLPGAAL